MRGGVISSRFLPRLCRVLSLAQKNILGLVQGATARIDLEFKNERGQPYKKTVPVKAKNGETEELPLYTNKDDILGEVRGYLFSLRVAYGGPPTIRLLAIVLQIRVTPLTTKKFEHQGIRVQLIGQIELASERGQPHDFVSLGEPATGSVTVRRTTALRSSCPCLARTGVGRTRSQLALESARQPVG